MMWLNLMAAFWAFDRYTETSWLWEKRLQAVLMFVNAMAFLSGALGV